MPYGLSPVPLRSCVRDRDRTRTLDAVRSLPSRHFSIRHFEDGDQIELTKDLFGTLDLGFVVLAHSDRDQVLAD